MASRNKSATLKEHGGPWFSTTKFEWSVSGTEYKLQQNTTHLLDIVDVCCKRKTDISDTESDESLRNEYYLTLHKHSQSKFIILIMTASLKR